MIPEETVVPTGEPTEDPGALPTNEPEAPPSASPEASEDPSEVENSTGIEPSDPNVSNEIETLAKQFQEDITRLQKD